jgi:hypothetical protein
MAAVIYTRRREAEGRPETRQTSVEEAWHLWHLAMDEGSDPGTRRLGAHPMEP